jgi:hypothetical protein
MEITIPAAMTPNRRPSTGATSLTNPCAVVSAEDATVPNVVEKPISSPTQDGTQRDQDETAHEHADDQGQNRREVSHE